MGLGGRLISFARLAYNAFASWMGWWPKSGARESGALPLTRSPASDELPGGATSAPRTEGLHPCKSGLAGPRFLEGINVFSLPPSGPDAPVPSPADTSEGSVRGYGLWQLRALPGVAKSATFGIRVVPAIPHALSPAYDVPALPAHPARSHRRGRLSLGRLQLVRHLIDASGVPQRFPHGGGRP